jgi:ligand-binding sensor domain-containing protein/signal transduction histidine kinase
MIIRPAARASRWNARLLFVAVVIFTAACSAVKSATAPINTLTEFSRFGLSVSGSVRAAEIDPEDTNISSVPPSYEEIWFEHFSADGIPSIGTVYCLLQDRFGFLWIGSNQGLARYDGYNLKVYDYDPNNPQSLSSNEVYALLEDRSGTLWVATYGGGLEKFDRDQDVFIHYQHDSTAPNSLSDNKVSTLIEDDAGLLWVGTSGGGLNSFDPSTGRFAHFRYDPDSDTSLSSDFVNVIYQDSSQRLWVGTTSGLNRFDTRSGEFVRYVKNPKKSGSLGGEQVYDILQDRIGNLWVGTYDGGLSRYDPQEGNFRNFVHDPMDFYSLSSNSVYSLLEDRWGYIWIGTLGGGLNLLDPDEEKFYHYEHDLSDTQSLSSNFINVLYEDRTGAIWVGTSLSLDHYDPNKPKFGLKFARNHVFSMWESPSSLLWVGALDGLYRYDREIDQVTHFRHIPGKAYSLSEWWVTSIVEDQSGWLWVGTAGGGLNRFNQATYRFNHYRHDPSRSDSLSSDVVNTVFLDRDGTLWVGTVNGLNEFDRKNERFYHISLSTSGNEPAGADIISAILEDSEGYLWIGTQGGGLKRLKRSKDELVTYRYNPSDPDSLRNNVINVIFEDSRQRLWIGSEGGLHLFDRENDAFFHYGKDDGLPDDDIYAVLEDDSGYLWLSTDNGLSRFNTEIDEFKNFDVGDGLQANQFSGAAYQRNNGEMYFGGINGITTFHPDQIRDNPYPPPVVLLSVRQDGSPIRSDRSFEQIDSITLSGTTNDYEFEYAALSFSQPEKNQYAYMLEGLDTDWNYTGGVRIAHFSNLPGGTYILRLKGANDDGIWNEVGTSIQLTIMPPFWETFWFRGLVLLIIAGTISGGYVIRVKSIAARNTELEALISERTSEIDLRRQELEALYQADTLMHRSLHLDHVLQALVDVAVDILNANKSAVYTWKEDADVLVLRVNRGFHTDNIDRFTCSTVEGLLGMVIARGELLILEDLLNTPYQDIESPTCYQAYLDEDVRSLMYLPIRIAGEVFGVFVVCFTKSHAFGEEEVRLFAALAQRAGLAIENAQLYESAQLLAVIEERGRLARDLHDSVKQKTFAALAQLSSASRLMDNDPPRARTPVDSAEELMHEVLQELNVMIDEMYPVALKERGLTAALRAYVDDWSDQSSTLVDLHVNGVPKISMEKAQALYRITQEALSNVSRHSQANEVVVSLHGNRENIELMVEDDGCGFDPQDVQAGVGLRSMRERVEKFNGSFQIESEHGSGTRLTAKIPV